VLQPVGEVGKVTRTVVALEGPHTGVYVGVLLELRVADEALVTDGAREGSLLQMHQIVDLQAALRLVHLSALLAAIGTRLRMVFLVTLQMGALLEPLLTLGALVRLLR